MAARGAAGGAAGAGADANSTTWAPENEPALYSNVVIKILKHSALCVAQDSAGDGSLGENLDTV